VSEDDWKRYGEELAVLMAMAELSNDARVVAATDALALKLGVAPEKLLRVRLRKCVTPLRDL
jgi:hypothetical protein